MDKPEWVPASQLVDISLCRSWGASVYLQVPLVHAPSPSQSPSYFRGEGILHVPPKPSVPVLANGLSRLPPSLGTCSSSLLCLCLPFIYSSPPLTPINVYKPSPRHAFGCFLPACPPCFTEGVPPIAAPSPGCAAWLLESCFLSSPRDWTVTAEAICDLKSNVLLSGHLPGPLDSPLFSNLLPPPLGFFDLLPLGSQPGVAMVFAGSFLIRGGAMGWVTGSRCVSCSDTSRPGHPLVLFLSSSLGDGKPEKPSE